MVKSKIPTPVCTGGGAGGTVLALHVLPGHTRTCGWRIVREGKVLKEMMVTLLEKQVIEVIGFDDLAFFNVVFLRPKPGGKWRLILDVSRLNKFLVTSSFKMDTVQSPGSGGRLMGDEHRFVGRVSSHSGA